MTTMYNQVKATIIPGQPIIIEPGSPIYKGPYQSKVMGFSNDGMRVEVPLDSGKLVLLPVGTRVKVSANLDGATRTLDMEIVMRTGGKERSLYLFPVNPKVKEKPKALRQRKKVPAIAISSGKGGVGKTTFAVNVALALSRMGHRVCVIDGDLGTANVDVLLNMSPLYNLAHVIRGEKHMLEVVMEGPEGLIVLPGGSGFQELTTLSEEKFDMLMDQFQQLEEYADYMLIDTGSGLSPSVTNFLVSADETVLITTPEPHAITDCYALIKVLSGHEYKHGLKLVVNRVASEFEGRNVAQKMAFASRKFLDTELDVLGYIAEDPAIGRSVRKQKPVLLEDKRARSAMQISTIAEALVSGESQAAGSDEGGSRSFLEKMRGLLLRRSVF